MVQRLKKINAYTPMVPVLYFVVYRTQCRGKLD